MSALGIRELLDDNPIVGQRRDGSKRFWTTAELKTLLDHYPRGGVAACVPVLPGRSANSIYQRAAILGIRTAAQAKRAGVPRQRWFSNPQIDAAIRNVYQGEPREGEVKALARTLGRPRWYVSKRATQLGLKSPRFKEPPWTEAELELAASNAHKQLETIARIMRGAGFARSPTAIKVKLVRMGRKVGREADVNHYTANHLSKLFGVDCHVVTAWIKKGWLSAGNRGTSRTWQQGGDEYWVHNDSVRQFVIENVAAVDFRKVDKFWLVDVLTNRIGSP